MQKNIAGVLLIIFLFSCTTDETPYIDEPIEGKVESAKLNEAISTFGWKLFHTQLEESNNNILISPLSIHTALSMTLQGAEKNTKEEMLKTLECSDISKEDIAVTYKELESVLYKKKESSELGGKNAIFYDDKRMKAYDDFLNINKDNFNSQNSILDFTKSTSIDNINQWAKNATNGKIDKILDEIKDEDVMFLINALYFKGDWEIGFDMEQTREDKFKKADGTSQTIPFMYSDDYRPYFSNEELRAVDMTIKESEYAVTFILPNEDCKSYLLDKVKDDLPKWYVTILEGMKKSRIETQLPKFEVKTKENLNTILKRLGMLDAFTANADLSKLGTSTLGKLFISRVLHDAYIKIDEKGIEGSAVTTVGVAVTSAPPQFKLNRPFIYVVRHIESGIPLFIGLYNGL